MEEKITQALNDWLKKYNFDVRVLGDYSDSSGDGMIT